MAALPIDPSIVTPGKGSKMAIDATIQWPEEGGSRGLSGAESDQAGGRCAGCV